MAEGKFTDGPWHVGWDGEGGAFVGGGGTVIADMVGPVEHRKANARLMAVSLEMLEVLKAILSHGELRNVEANPEARFLGGKKPATKDVWTFPRHMLTDLEAAIAKAERQP